MSLADEFVRRGHAVKVVTQTPREEPDEFSFEVIRGPSPRQLISLGRWCDVYWQNNISLQTLWPLLVTGFRKPIFVTYQTWVRRLDGKIGWQDRLKFILGRRCSNIAISQAVAAHLPFPTTLVGNPYRDTVFHPDEATPRDRDLVFVGRLVSSKGANLLVETVRRLQAQGLKLAVTIIGQGPELESLQRQARDLPITFPGILRDEALAAQLRAHQLIVIPSAWDEPFGIVALEGIACGCVAVASRAGGLAEAVGPCGQTFPNGDIEALTALLSGFLSRRTDLAPFRLRAEEHLRSFRVATVAQTYVRLFGGDSASPGQTVRTIS